MIIFKKKFHFIYKLQFFNENKKFTKKFCEYKLFSQNFFNAYQSITFNLKYFCLIIKTFYLFI